MGSSLSSSCLSPKDSTNREVVVMKEDGEVIRFLEGTRVTDILAAHPHHKMIKCCSDRSVLPNSYKLSCNRLYFLLPAGLAVCDAIYGRLVRAAVSKELILSQRITSEANDQKMVVEVESCGDDILFDDDDFEYKSPWKPGLQTIPEGVSPPPLHANV